MEQIGKRSQRKPKVLPVVETLGQALPYKNPILALWPALVKTAFGDGQRPELNNLTKPAATLYLTDLVHREVQNGGFHQFFNNTSGLLARESVAALKEIKAEVFADILARAIAVFPEALAANDRDLWQMTVQDYLEQREAQLKNLDDEFNSKVDFRQENCADGVENQYFLALNFMEINRDSAVKASDVR